MSTFITRDDYITRITDRILEQLVGETDEILDNAELTAKAIITDRLGNKFDLNAELAKTSTERNHSLVRWMLSLSVYLFYSRVPDTQVPERVIKDYDDAMKELEQIQQGKLGCALARLTDDEGEVISRFRMGNNEPRSHDPFNVPV